jgi:hypothetical protein
MNWRMFTNIKESSLALWLATERKNYHFHRQIEAAFVDKDVECEK